ncbi:MAG: GNAT family N-acetyltransferase [Dehalococcoidia bacterium]
MNLPGQFETRRLVIRRTTVEDAAAFLRGEVPVGIRSGAGYPSESTLEVADLIAGPRAAAVPGFTSWFMTLRDTGETIGEAGFTPSADESVATAGYGLSPAFEGRGYASEALAGLVAHLFAHSPVTVVRADTLVSHVASRRVMEKAGLRFMREFEGDVDGRIERLVLYECVKDWWTDPAAP